MKNKRGIKLLVIFVLSISSLILNGNINIQSDSLFVYQWGLKNDGKLSLKQDVLHRNNNIEYFDINNSKSVFNGQDYNKMYFLNTDDQSFALAKTGIDIDYSNAYDLYKNADKKLKEIDKKLMLRVRFKDIEKIANDISHVAKDNKEIIKLSNKINNIIKGGNS